MKSRRNFLYSSTILKNAINLALISMVVACSTDHQSSPHNVKTVMFDTQYHTPKLKEAQRNIIIRKKENASAQQLAESYRLFARTFYDKYEFYDDNSIDLLQQASLLDDNKARFYLGKYYSERGEYTKAIYWLQPAAQDYVPAKALLGTIYEYLRQGSGEEMIEEAILQYKEYIDQGDLQYHKLLAQLYNDNHSPFYNGQRAFQHLLAALEHHPQDGDALQMLADIYREGRVVPRDKQKALDYTETLAKAGNTHAMALLADAFEPGGWYIERPYDALYWQYKYVTAKHQNHYMFGDYVKLAHYYATGYGTQQHFDYAEYYYDKALLLRPGQAYKIAAMLENLPSPEAKKLSRKYHVMVQR